MKIKDTSINKLKSKLTEEIAKAYKIAGYNITNLSETVNLMYENMVKFFPNNDLSDISTAFEKGALGEYGEYAGISVRTLYSWMRTFNGNAVNRVAEIEPETPSEEEPRDKKQDGRNLVNSCYDTYRKTGCFFAPASMLIKILGDNGIDLSKGMDEAKAAAEANLEDTFKRQRAEFRFKKMKDFVNDNLDTEASGVAVKNYFKRMINEKKETIF